METTLPSYRSGTGDLAHEAAVCLAVSVVLFVQMWAM